ncbi:YraN family protein [Persephonella sp.]
MEKYKQGKVFEDMAVDHLKNSGYKILERNFQTRYGEIDIIAEKDNQIIIIEVRGKKNTYFGKPEETISRSKIRRILKTTQIYIKSKNLHNRQIRFDIISIVDNNIFHIKNAFDVDF